MASVDPYSPCPCGSGKKFKWCCQKVEAYAERAHRLEGNGQHDAALAVYDEGLSKVPSSPWLLLRKAVLLMGQERLDEAKACTAKVVQQEPANRGAASMMCRLVLVTEGPVAAAAELQRALLRVKPESRQDLAQIVALTASELGKAGYFPAAMKHFELAMEFGGSLQSILKSSIGSFKSNPAVSPWLKEQFPLDEAREPARSGSRAVQPGAGLAREGLWDSAASAFELLSADPVAGPAADRNQGLCRLWLGDDAAAVKVLGRWIAREGPTSRAVDLEILCQLLDESTDTDPIEQVQLTWPLRDRDAFLRILERDPAIIAGPKRHLDVDDEESPEMDCCYLLDRPRIEARTGLTREEIPLILANILVGPDNVVLETFDDGRLNPLIDRFTELAGRSVPPAHPRTKVIDQVDRSEQAMSWHWYLPPEMPSRKKSDSPFSKLRT